MSRRKIISQTVTRPFVAGFELPWNSKQTDDFLSTYKADDFSNMSSFFINHHLDHIRFPGLQSRFFFYDDRIINGVWLSDDANTILNAVYPNRDFAPITDRKATMPLFLKFCSTCSMTPIVVLNTLFYVYNDTLYPTEELNAGPYADFGVEGMELDDTRWTHPQKIKAYIPTLAEQAHATYSGNITWEIGNENKSVLTASAYAFIVEKFMGFIKDLYPSDKFLVSLSKGAIVDETSDQWNVDFIAALNTAGLLSSIDWVVHYYPSKLYTALTYATQGDIDTRVEDTFFNSDLMAVMLNYFSGYEGYSPKFSLTEFNIFDDPIALQNTQLHAIFMLDGMMKFKKESSIKSVTKHAGPLIKNGIFFQLATARMFPYYNANIQDSVSFPYVTPQGKAMAIFLDNLCNTVDSYSLNDEGNGLEILITKTSTLITCVQILNYKAAVADYDLSAYNGAALSTWVFGSLSNNYWDEETSKITAVVNGTHHLPAHSFTTIIVKS